MNLDDIINSMTSEVYHRGGAGKMAGWRGVDR